MVLERGLWILMANADADAGCHFLCHIRDVAVGALWVINHCYSNNLVGGESSV